MSTIRDNWDYNFRDYRGNDTDERDFPDNTSTTGLVESNWLDYGRINTAGDVDWFKVNLAAGEYYKFQIEAGSVNGLFSPRLSIYDSNSQLLVTGSMGQGFQTLWAELTPTTSGSYYLSASGTDGLFGNYNLYILNGQTTANSTTQSATAKTGTSGNDSFNNTNGNESFDGGAGIDTLVMSGKREACPLSKTTQGWSISSETEGSDTLSNVERIQFADKRIALDITDNALETLQFIGIIAPTLQGNLNVRGTIISLFDQGKSMQEMSQLALDLGLITTEKTALAKTVFKNVFNTTADPDQNLANSLVSYIEQNGQAKFLATVAGMNINVDLVGLQQNGMEYIL